MRIFLLFTLILLSFSSNGQKTALLSKDFKRPILYTDSLTVEQVKTGYFPVRVEDFDTLYASLEYLSKMLLDLKRAKMKSFEFKAGKTTIKTITLPYAYGDHFEIIGTTNLNEIESVFSFTAKGNNKRNSNRLQEFMKYLESNKSWFKKTNQIHPKFYNVVVITE